MGAGKPNSFCNYFVESSLPTSWWFIGGRISQPKMTAGPDITGSQDFIPGVETRFRFSRDLRMIVVRETPAIARMHVLVRFFLCRVYIDSSRHDTLEYE
jgi:hypothetical protein